MRVSCLHDARALVKVSSHAICIIEHRIIQGSVQFCYESNIVEITTLQLHLYSYTASHSPLYLHVVLFVMLFCVIQLVQSESLMLHKAAKYTSSVIHCLQLGGAANILGGGQCLTSFSRANARRKTIQRSICPTFYQFLRSFKSNFETHLLSAASAPGP